MPMKLFVATLPILGLNDRVSCFSCASHSVNDSDELSDDEGGWFEKGSCRWTVIVEEEDVGFEWMREETEVLQ